jgi:type I restriction enzyme S subunit
LLDKINEEKIKTWEEECRKAELEGKKKPSKPKLKTVEEMKISDDEKPYDLPQGWEWVRLGDVVSKLTDGSHNPPKGEEGGLPMYSATNVLNNFLDISKPNRLISYDDFVQENKRTSIEENDVLLTIVGTIGRSLRVKKEYGKFVLQRSVAVITLIEIISEFVVYFFQSNFSKEVFELETKGTAQKGIYLNSLKKLFIPLPPLSEQQEIVARIEALLKAEEDAKELINMEEQIDLLEKSILSKAFRGELGTNDLSDEPALELLKRVLGE